MNMDHHLSNYYEIKGYLQQSSRAYICSKPAQSNDREGSGWSGTAQGGNIYNPKEKFPIKVKETEHHKYTWGETPQKEIMEERLRQTLSQARCHSMSISQWLKTLSKLPQNGAKSDNPTSLHFTKVNPYGLSIYQNEEKQ